MIEVLTDLPDGVIGFDASGKLHAEDYKDTLLPVVERAAEAGGVRLVLVVHDFDGVSAGGAWQDLTMGIEHLRVWKKTALVTDVEWMVHLVNLFGWMSPGEFKHFTLDQRDEAITWAAA